MRPALGVLIAALVTAGSNVSLADQYRWCAAYSGSEEGSYNCYFVTLQQCQATVSGVGGFCIPSPYANTPATPTPRPRKKKSS